MGTDIPGLIEPAEFEALEKVSGLVVPGSSIIEFGCYLGKSTSAILKGANLIEGTKLFVFDGFKIKETDPFALTMLGHVHSLGLTELVYRDKKGFFHWEKVFDSLIQPHSNKNLVWTKCDCTEATWTDEQEIAMIHLDAPKDYHDLKPILFRFFGSLRQDSIIVFQDFFYHWSASVIQVVALMERKGLIEFETSFASSLYVKLVRSLLFQDLIELDLEVNKSNIFEDIDYVLQVLDRNKDKFDRYEKFRTQIDLAYLSEAVISKHGEKAANRMHQMLSKDAFRKDPEVISHFLELFRNNFSMK
jgi:hypothetical protein